MVLTTRVNPSRECFHVDQRDHDEGNHLGMPEVDDPPGPASRVGILRELAVVPVPTGGRDTQLEQICEMQAKVDEETGRLVQLDKTWSRSGQAEPSPEEPVIGPGTSSVVSSTMPGQLYPRPSAGPTRT
jgi:hypothetical protein